MLVRERLKGEDTSDRPKPKPAGSFSVDPTWVEVVRADEERPGNNKVSGLCFSFPHLSNFLQQKAGEIRGMRKPVACA